MLPNYQTAEYISSCLQLAILLEVSASKPGNVNRTVDFEDTRFEHYLASAVAVGPNLELAAQHGIKAQRGEIDPSEIGIGRIIGEAVTSITAWHHGGNTLLGTVLLLSPIAAAAGMTLSNTQDFSISRIRENIETVVKSTTSRDASALYEAISIANPGGLTGHAPTLDVNDPESKRRIVRENIALYDVFSISAEYDSISREWVKNFPATFDLGLPYFTRQLEKTENLNTSTVHTFLKVLSAIPDTLIARKTGQEMAEKVSARAEEVLRLGGLTSTLGKRELLRFDAELRNPTNKNNPGTTADIVAAVLALKILEGYRP